MRLILAAASRTWGAYLLLVTLVSVYAARETADGIFRFDVIAGTAAVTDVLRVVLPLFAFVMAASWVARMLEGNGYRDLYLARVPLCGFLQATGTRVACLILSLAVVGSVPAILGSAFVWAHPARPLPGGVVPDFVMVDLSPRVALLIVVVLLWAFLGVLLGCVVDRAAFSVAAAVGLYFSAVLLERAAVIHPTALWLHAVSPLGATNALLLGESVPDFPLSQQTATLSHVAFGVWLAAAIALARRQTWPGYLGRAWQSRRSTALRASGAMVVAGALLLLGFVVPTTLSERIPWHLKASWRQTVAAHQAPSDTVTRLVSALAAGREVAIDTPRRTDEVALSQFRRAVTKVRVEDVSVYDVLQGAGPGSVVVNVGTDTAGDDEIVPAPQFGFCLVESNGTWTIRSISPQGVTCG